MTETQLKNYYPLKQEVKQLEQLRATLQRERQRRTDAAAGSARKKARLPP